MPFGFSVYPKTEQEYLEELGDVLKDSDTIVFLDTNVLAHLYKLHLDARNEFYSWADGLLSEERLKIPAWALSEYLAKFKQGKLKEYTVKSNEPNEIKKKLENLHSMASLFVDQSLLSKINFNGDRKQFLEAFEKAIDVLPSFTAVFNQEFDAATIHDEIASKLSFAVLPSDIARLCVRAGNEGELRNSHRMPPGFKDSSKTENKNGDIIIWFEILDYATKMKNKFKRVVFLTNDEKPDWVYPPSKRIHVDKGCRKQVPNTNPIIKLPDPRLVAEFNAKVGYRDLHIITLPIFIKALSKSVPDEFKNLAEAIQVESEVATSDKDTAVADDVSEIIQEAPSEDTCIQAPTEVHIKSPIIEDTIATASDYTVYPPDALRDSAYEINLASDIDLVIRDLKSHDWYTQNPAIIRIKSIRHREFNNGAWFVLGRNIYQAACGNSQKALEFMRNLDIELFRHANESANHILSGMIYEIFFDCDGNFRPLLKANFVDQTFAVISTADYQLSKSFIQKALAPYRDRIYVIPGDIKMLHLSINIAIEIETSIHYLESVMFDHKQLVQEADKDDVFRFSGARFWTSESIVTRLSKNYGIPKNQIVLDLIPEEATEMPFRVREGKVLCL